MVLRWGLRQPGIPAARAAFALPQAPANVTHSQLPSHSRQPLDRHLFDACGLFAALPSARSNPLTDIDTDAAQLHLILAIHHTRFTPNPFWDPTR